MQEILHARLNHVGLRLLPSLVPRQRQQQVQSEMQKAADAADISVIFLAVQNSSIGDLVTDSVTQSLTHFYF